jgi:hypothetical protein
MGRQAAGWYARLRASVGGLSNLPILKKQGKQMKKKFDDTKMKKLEAAAEFKIKGKVCGSRWTLGTLRKWGIEHDKMMDAHFTYDKKMNTLTISIQYPYEVDLDRIKTHMNLLFWVKHLAGKTWMNTDHLREFMHRVCEIKKWEMRSC